MKYDERLQEMVKGMLDGFGIESIPEAHRGPLVEKIADSLAKRIFLMTFERLGEDGAKEYETLLASDASDEEARKFLLDRIPEYDDLVRKEVEELKALMQSAGGDNQ